MILKFQAVVTMRRQNMIIYNGTENLCQKKKRRNELALVMMSSCGLRCAMQEASVLYIQELNKYFSQIFFIFFSRNHFAIMDQKL